jgi:hypothetical protein
VTRHSRAARVFAAVAAIASIAVLVAPPARASGLDPGAADAHVRAAMEQEGRAYCESPPKPLPDAATRLCPLARDVPGCEKLVAACEARDVDVDLPKVPTGFAKWLASVLQAVGPIAAWVLVALVVVAILLPVVMAIRSRSRDRKREPKAKKKATAESTPLDLGEPLEPGGDAEALLRAAEESAAAGALDRALFGFLRAALVALDQRGAIRITRDRTHGEYVRSCRDAEAKPSLRAMVSEVDRVRFGGEPATADRVRDLSTRAKAIVRAARAAAVMATLAVAFLASGCGRFGARGADPGGPELFLALLHQQGVQVGAPSGPLASLPLPESASDAPVLVLDAERVPLDDESRARLVRWVRAGGVLVIAGAPESWPEPFEAHAAATRPTRDARFRTFPSLAAQRAAEAAGAEGKNEEDLAADDDARSEAREPDAPREDVAHLARAESFTWGLTYRAIATLSGEHIEKGAHGDATYAATASFGAGRVLAFANDDLFTNLGLARPGNAAPLVAALAELGNARFLVARPEHAASPPSDPISALVRAGLGLALLHSLALVLVLFLAKGARLGRPAPTRPPARRAFVEHVRAVGALYDRADLAGHALVAYGRFAIERLRARLPRGEHDLAAFLATRSGRSREACEALLKRARGDEDPRAPRVSSVRDDVETLGELGDATAQALAAAPRARRAR